MNGRSRRTWLVTLAVAIVAPCGLRAAELPTVVVTTFDDRTDDQAWVSVVLPYLLTRDLDNRTPLDVRGAFHPAAAGPGKSDARISGEIELASADPLEFLVRTHVDPPGDAVRVTFVAHGPVDGLSDLSGALVEEIARSLDVTTTSPATAGKPPSRAALESFARGLTATDSSDRVLALEAATRTDPRFVDAFVELGRALSSIGSHDTARLRLERAVELEPDDARARAELGRVLMAGGDAPGARAQLTRAVELAPRDPRRHTQLGDALRALDQRGEAIASYRRALTLAPDDVEALAGLSLLQWSATDGTGADAAPVAAEIAPSGLPAGAVPERDLRRARQMLDRTSGDRAVAQRTLTEATRALEADDIGRVYAALARFYRAAGLTFSADSAERIAAAIAAAEPAHVPPATTPSDRQTTTPLTAQVAPAIAPPEIDIDPEQRADLARAEEAFAGSRRPPANGERLLAEARSHLDAGDEAALYAALGRVYDGLKMRYAARTSHRRSAAAASPPGGRAAALGTPRPAPIQARATPPPTQSTTPPAIAAGTPDPQLELTWARRMLGRFDDRAEGRQLLDEASAANTTGDVGLMYERLARFYDAAGLSYSAENALKAARAAGYDGADTTVAALERSSPTAVEQPSPSPTPSTLRQRDTRAERPPVLSTRPPMPASTPEAPPPATTAAATPIPRLVNVRVPGTAEAASSTPDRAPVATAPGMTAEDHQALVDARTALRAGRPGSERARSLLALAEERLGAGQPAQMYGILGELYEELGLRYSARDSERMASAAVGRSLRTAPARTPRPTPAPAVVPRSTPTAAPRQSPSATMPAISRATPTTAREAAALDGLPAEEVAHLRAAVVSATAVLASWRDAWQAADLDAYMKSYAPEFRSDGRDRAAWRAHKAKVFATAGDIAVGIADVGLALDGGPATLRFDQIYRSRRLSDRGRKTLRLTRRDDRSQILAEAWTAAPRRGDGDDDDDGDGDGDDLVAVTARLESDLESILETVGAWRAAWAAEDLDGYIEHYGASFRSDGRDRAALRNHKRAVFARSGDIRVTIAGLALDLDARRASVVFDQSYRSATVNDEGRKTLTLARTADGWSIVAESWKPATR